MQNGWTGEGANGPSGDHVTRPTAESPLHPMGAYDATDSRHDHGSQNGWKSVDVNSGPVNPHDWDDNGRYPDSGKWRQT